MVIDCTAGSDSSKSTRTPTDTHRVDAEVKGKEEEEEERNGGSGSSEDSKRALAHRTIGRREERAIEKVINYPTNDNKIKPTVLGMIIVHLKMIP